MAEVATVVRPADPFHLDKVLTSIARISDVGNATFEPLYTQPGGGAPPANYGATSA